MPDRVIAVIGLTMSFSVLIARGDAGSRRVQSNGQQTNDAQASQPDKQNAKNLLARLSYDSTYVADERGERRSPRVCFEVYRDGRYRVSRATVSGTENLGGKLTPKQLNLLANLLKKVDFENQGGGIVRQGAETLVAEIARADGKARYIWVDPDHQRPFPEAAARVIRWLQDFKAQGASVLTAPELSTMQICPRMSDNPVQPVIASIAKGSPE